MWRAHQNGSWLVSVHPYAHTNFRNTYRILMKFYTWECCQELLSRLNVSLYLVILTTISREGIYAFLGSARANLTKSLPKQRLPKEETCREALNVRSMLSTKFSHKSPRFIRWLKNLILCVPRDCAMAQAVCQKPLNAEVRLRSQANPCGISGE